MNTLSRLLVLAEKAPHGQTEEEEIERQGTLEQARDAIQFHEDLMEWAKIAHARMTLAMANDHSMGSKSGITHEHCEGLRLAINTCALA